MALSRRYWLLLTFLLLIVALVGGVGLLSGPLLEPVVKPRLVALVAERLQGRVELERMELHWDSLQLSGLHVVKGEELELTAPHLRVVWNWTDLWRKQLALLEIDEPTILTRQAGSKPAGQEPVTWRGLPLTVEQVTVHNGRVQVNTSDRHFSFSNLDVTLPLGVAGLLQAQTMVGSNQIPLHLCGAVTVAEQLHLRLDQLSWGDEQLLEAPLELGWAPGSGAGAEAALSFYDLSQKTLSRWLTAFDLSLPESPVTDWHLEEVTLRGSLEEGGVHFAAAGRGVDIAVAGRRLNLEEFKLDGKGRGPDWALQFQGKLEPGVVGTYQGNYGEAGLTGDWSATIDDLGAAVQQLAGTAVPTRDGLLAQGTVAWQAGQGRVSADLQGKTGKSQGDSTLLLQSLTGKVDVAITPDGPRGRLLLNLDQRPWLSVEGTPKQARFQLKNVSQEGLQKIVPQLVPDTIQSFSGLTSQGDVRSSKGVWHLSAKIKAKRITFSGGDVGEPSLAVQARWRGEQLLIDKLDLQTALSGAGVTLPKVSLAAAGTVSSQAVSLQIKQLQAADGEYMSEDGMSGFSGGHLQGQGLLEWQAGLSQLGWTGTLTGGIGEALYGAFYADLSALPVSLASNLIFDASQHLLGLKRLKLQAAGLGEVEQSGEIRPNRIALVGRFDFPELGGKLATLVQEAVGPSFPQLKEMAWQGRLQGGFQLALAEGGGWLQTSLQPQQLDLSWSKNRLRLTGVDGILPVLIQWGAHPEPLATPDGQAGFLTMQKVEAGPLSLHPGPLEIHSLINRWQITSPLIFSLADGTLRIADLTAGWKTTGPLFDANINLTGVELKPLTEELQLPPMSGTLNADLGRISYQDNALESAGKVKIDVFGGHMTISNIRYQDPWSSYATLNADIDFSGLDLQQLTHTFEFGEMNGVLDGYVHNLRLFGLVPSRFDALIESKESGTRNISVKALNNLAVISQGALLGTLSRGIYRFIDFYRYRKIGLRLNLENDVFRLTGTALSGDERYLVYGGLLPPRIDIVAPQNTISFKEMLKRLSRIDRTSRQR